MVSPNHKNKIFYFNNNKDTRKGKEAFKISLIRKFILPFLNVQNIQNRSNVSNLFHGQSRAKYLIGPKIMLMALYSILLQTINSLLLPLEPSLHRTSNFAPKPFLWHCKQNESHSHFIFHWKMS